MGRENERTDLCDEGGEGRTPRGTQICERGNEEHERWSAKREQFRVLREQTHEKTEREARIFSCVCEGNTRTNHRVSHGKNEREARVFPCETRGKQREE